MVGLKTNVRVQILTVDDANVLSDVYLDLHIADAKSMTRITDETSIALRYYVCYLVSINWDSLDAIESREGVKYRKPDPIKYKNLYNDEISNDLDDEDKLGLSQKVSTSKENNIDDCGVLVYGTDPDLDCY